MLHDYWLRADEEAPDDGVLYGELGYWRHWWNLPKEQPDRATRPLEMLMIVADDESFVERAWLDEFEGDL